MTNFPPNTTIAEVRELRPKDAAYHAYALHQVLDLVQRYSPSVLWNDIGTRFSSSYYRDDERGSVAGPCLILLTE